MPTCPPEFRWNLAKDFWFLLILFWAAFPLPAQVPRQVSFWASRQYFDQQNTTSDPSTGVTDVKEVFNNNLYNIDFLPSGSYTVTTSRNNAWNRDYGTTIYNASFTQIKQVNSIYLRDMGNTKLLGWGKPPYVTLTTEVARNPIAWMHEFGHSLGLEHRNDSVNNLMFSAEQKAPMTAPGWEINRAERPAFER